MLAAARPGSGLGRRLRGRSGCHRERLGGHAAGHAGGDRGHPAGASGLAASGTTSPRRCLGCANCTHGLPDLLLRHRRGHRPISTATTAERWRTWDSCFTARLQLHPRRQHPHAPAAARYRQWITHKLGFWHDQFGRQRLRRLRPLHHLVPGRHRHHRGGAAVRPRPRGGALSHDHGRAAWTRSCASTRSSPASTERYRTLIAGCAANRRRSRQRLRLSGGRAGRPLLPDPHGQGGARGVRPRARRRSSSRRLRERRPARLVVAGPALTAAASTRARSSSPGVISLRRRLPARQDGGGPRPRLRALQAVCRR